MKPTAGSLPSTANPLTDRGALQQRFWQYLIDDAPKNRQQQDADKVEADYWQGKLEVERVAQQQRQADLEAQQQQIQQFQQRFVSHYDKELQRVMASPELISQGSPITEAELGLLDELLSPNVNRNRVLTQLTALPSLSNALVRYVNKQQLQRDGAPVTNVRLAFNFLGVEELQQVLPWLQFQLWRRNGPTSLRLRKLWRMLQQQKKMAGKLAPSFGCNSGLAEGLAVLQSVEIMLLLHIGENLFEQLRHKWLTHARQAGEKLAHQAIFDVKLPSRSLVSAWQKPHLWGFQTLSAHLSNANKRFMVEMAQQHYHKLSAATEVVAHAHLITISSTLKKRKLVEPEQLVLWRYSYPSLADATKKYA
ncbi:hypothetical protein [Ferrimonas lipolytica]|uniref:HDOD domain-containing protein n=1 Tax=Ferrimonas lipolytica TaxID=2724191 RepID=A0A6H1UFF7_9GAMM|nr:hypothetical protein [Ferrimonas lipolytica]QIZ77835.1 hypothetical protein HER31_13570 [Ferrimonas lipolytica]